VAGLFLTIKQHVLILGAGIDQVYPIKKAKELNYFVSAVDGNPDAPGKEFCDFFYNVSNRDTDSINRIVQNSELPIDGIFLMGSDIPDIYEDIRRTNNLNGFKIEEPLFFRNKFLMKEKLLSFDIPIPNFTKVFNANDVLLFLRKYKRIIIKPLDSSGSRGVFLIDDPEISSSKIELMLNEAKMHDSNGNVMAESFLDGPQLSTESIFQDYEQLTLGYADRNYEDTKNLYPNIIENGGIQPSIKVFEYKTEVETIIQKAAEAFNFSSGILKCDIVIHNGAPKIIEIAARLSGGDFSETLIPCSSDYDFVGNALHLCMGHKISLKKDINYKVYVANRYFFGQQGKIKEIKSSIDISKDWLIKLDFFKKPGDFVRSPKSHTDRLGVFLVKAKSYETLQKRINDIYKSIEFIYE
jgi:biotin carboxylase